MWPRLQASQDVKKGGAGGQGGDSFEQSRGGSQPAAAVVGGSSGAEGASVGSKQALLGNYKKAPLHLLTALMAMLSKHRALSSESEGEQATEGGDGGDGEVRGPVGGPSREDLTSPAMTHLSKAVFSRGALQVRRPRYIIKFSIW